MRRLRGLVALVALAFVVFGIPLLLVRVAGAPWPDTMPNPSGAVDSLRDGRIDAGVVVAVLAALLWVAWARLVVSLLVEMWHVRRGREVPRVLVLGAGTQRLAALLVSSLSLLGGVATRGAAADAASVSEVLARLMPDSAPTGGREELVFGAPWTVPEQGAVVQDGGTGGTTTIGWTVRQHDSWWGLAETLFEDGARWREIHELNVGREVAPGVVLDAAAESVEPGWLVLLPAAPVVTVEPGDTLSAIARETLGDAVAWPEIWEVNGGDSFDGRVFEDPNLILPGWRLEMPTTTVVAPRRVVAAHDAFAQVEVVDAVEVVPPEPPQTPALATLAPPQGEPASAVPPSATVPDDECAVVVALPASSREGRGLAGAALVASGAMVMVELSRRRRLRSAPAHTRLPAPSSTAEQTELALRALERSEQLVRLDLALRAAAGRLAPPGQLGLEGARVLLAIVAPTGAIEIHLDRAVEAPPPWRATGERSWELPAGVTVEELAVLGGDRAMPCQALAHVGRSSAGEVYLDVEAVGVLRIEGDDDDTAPILRAVALGLALSPFSLSASLVGTAGGAARWRGGRAWQVVESVDEAVELAAACTSGLGARLGHSGSTFTARAASGAEAWEPTIVVLRRGDVGAGEVQMLSAIAAGGGAGVAVVTDAPGVEGGALLHVGAGDVWTLDPFGIELFPVGLEIEEADAIEQLLDEARSESLVEEDAPPARSEPVPAWELLIRVLGPLEVVASTGRAAVFERSKALELVAWLGLHRERATRSGARTALWDLDVRDATFANVVSDARRSLARSVAPPPGEEWIGRTLTDQLPLHPLVVSDVELLRARLRRARAASGDEAVAELREGLALVRGQVFSGTGFLWPDTSGLTSELVLLVVSAATELASRCLERGDIEGVFWATGQGLAVLPGHEELVGLRMQAHGAAGDYAGVRAVWAEYERSLVDPWGDSEASPKLVRLRRQLLSCTDRGSTPPSTG